MLNEPQRTWKITGLAQAVDISLGQVANVKKLLVDREWLGVNDNGMYLSRPGDLLDDWVKAYNYRRNQLHEFYSLSEISTTETDLAETCERLGARYALTSFSAAIRIAPMVRYNRVMAYVRGDLSMVATEAKLKPVPSGANVILLTPYDEGVFYAASSVGGIMIASPVQVYLDVIGSAPVARKPLMLSAKNWKQHGSQTERLYFRSHRSGPQCVAGTLPPVR